MKRENVINEIIKRGYDAFENKFKDEIIILNEGYTKGFPVENVDILLKERMIEKDGDMIPFPPISPEDIAAMIISSFNTRRDIDNGLYD